MRLVHLAPRVTGSSPKRMLTIGLLVVGGVLAACGGGDDSTSAGGGTTTTAAPASTEPKSEYPFADFKFVRLNRPDCEKTESLGKKASLTLVLPPSPLPATPWTPQCITDVKQDKITVTITSNSDYQHNFIVEGNEVEVYIGPGKKKTVEIELPQQGQIGFQCTLRGHQPMFGAFFR